MIRDPDAGAIVEAARVLRAGGVVGFPTETVYGLGALAFNKAAVARIFALKGRPSDNPLIVHAGAIDAISEVARDLPEVAARLLRAFAPGPLTVVLRRRAEVPAIVSSGLDTVAVRVPDHPVALALIAAAGGPLAAPSANRSGRPSPTSAADVADDFGPDLLVLDGGPTLVGLESTVVAFDGERVRLLRPGGISIEEIVAIAGPVLQVDAGQSAASPGTRHAHYAPRCRVVLSGPSGVAAEAARHARAGARAGALVRDASLAGTDLTFVREAPGDIAAYGRAIFRAFRDAEAAGVDVLVVETVDEGGLGLAIMDRLRRAAGERA